MPVLTARAIQMEEAAQSFWSPRLSVLLDLKHASLVAAVMFEFSINEDVSPEAFYQDLEAAARALVEGEPDTIANMANISALIWQFVPELNWAGFYRLVDDELVLGPFQGKTACIRIPLGKGVCGTAAATGQTQRVADVHAFPGHIACDADSRSELVVPVMQDKTIVGVLDLDSPRTDRFSQQDQEGLSRLVTAIAPALTGALS